jgi:hypothetical protein
MLIIGGKYHDSNVLDEIPHQPDATYVMDKAYVDFKALYCAPNFDSYFVARSK